MSTPNSNRAGAGRFAPMPPGSMITSHGRSNPRYGREEYNEYIRELTERMREDYERRRTGATSQPIVRGPSLIEVETVELYCRENAKEHHTEMFDIVNQDPATCVLRRGQNFYLAIRFKRTFNPRIDKVRLEFTFGPEPHQLHKGTLIDLLVTENKNFTREIGRWDIRLQHVEGNVITVHIQVPATIGVGVYRLRVVSEGPGGQRMVFKYPDNMYILFNPWCKDDSVYMERDDWRNEYVLNDVGKIYVGSFNQPKGRRWIYGQFTGTVLPSCMYMMELSGLDYTARANPVRVSRAISSCVNREDENGVVVGNWSGNYDDGTAPWMWTGSTAIMEQFFKNAGDPVKYGQCWVFAGVVTTVCRALGLPCRTVTCFVAAHDTDESMTVDKFFDAEGEEIEEANNDSIWNFHVWNDCWMSRQDLPKGYGGWQTIDATPQETSDGVYRVGPCSVEAVRRGEIGFMYDGTFVFSEVNADVIHWQLDIANKQGWKRLQTNKYHVGRSILCKKPGVDDDYGERDAEEIIAQYKNPEGSDEERMAVLNAARNGGLSHLYEMPAPHEDDVYMDLMDIERIKIGDPFVVTVMMENKSRDRRTVNLMLSASSIFYTGILAKKIGMERSTHELMPRQRETKQLTITCEQYCDKLVDYAMVKIYAIGTVKETQQTWAEEDDFMVDKPGLTLHGADQIEIGKQYTLDIGFTNPLNRTLSDCVFTVEGPGLSHPFMTHFRDIHPMESIMHRVHFSPQRIGDRKIVVVLNTRQLMDIMGNKQIIVV